MSSDDGSSDSAAERAVLRNQGVYLPSALAAYRSRKQLTSRLRFDPEAVQPRWRYARIAVAVLALVLAASLVAHVPFGSVGTVVGVNEDLVVIARSVDEPITGSPELILRVAGARYLVNVIEEEVVEEGDIPLQVTVMSIQAGAVLDDAVVGAPAMLEFGSRPLLVDMLRRGRP